MGENQTVDGIDDIAAVKVEGRLRQSPPTVPGPHDKPPSGTPRAHLELFA